MSETEYTSLEKLERFINPNSINDISISLSSTIVALILSIFASLIVRFLYLKYSKSLNNKEYFANNFIILCLTTCLVIIIVKYSLALSLGLVGALSIVRFRAAIKEPEELVYLFLIIAFGIVFGSNQFLIGIISLIIIVLIIPILSKYLGNKYEFENTGIVIIFEGQDEKILKIKNDFKSKLKKYDGTLIIKEISLDKNESRLILNASSNGNNNYLYNEIEKMALDNSLKLSIVSDVTVPA